MFEHYIAQVQGVRGRCVFGSVMGASDTTVEVSGLGNAVAVGDRIAIHSRDGRIPGEVVTASRDKATTMLHDAPEGISPGDRVDHVRSPVLQPSQDWLGRILDSTGTPVDGGGPPRDGDVPCDLRAKPPKSGLRRHMDGRIDTGVRAMNTFVPLCRGQRIGIFAGSGVGKSTLMAMLASNLEADVVVVGLVGERGREVREFVDKVLGEDGMAKTVVVSETSDEAPLARRDAAYAATAVAESYRDAGYHVLLLLDSVTRFAAAQREIGLAADEPPTRMGYPPSVFSRLSGLLERAGPGSGSAGDITAVYTVLVEGDDQNEPVSDIVRATLDGHIVLDRSIAERGRYPAIDVLRSVSRSLPECHTDDENELLRRTKSYLSQANDKLELAQIGAYRRGMDSRTDLALDVHDVLEREFLGQKHTEAVSVRDSFEHLRSLVEQVEQTHHVQV